VLHLHLPQLPLHCRSESPLLVFLFVIRQGSAVAFAAAVLSHPPKRHVISTEAAHGLIVSSAVERSLYFVFALASPLARRVTPPA
jgi:hypothetical protein